MQKNQQIQQSLKVEPDTEIIEENPVAYQQDDKCPVFS